MKRNPFNPLQALVSGIALLSLTGCGATTVIAPVIGPIGTGVAMGAQYVLNSPVSQTTTHELDRVKEALLIALCKMKIPVDRVEETERGEKIFARTADLEISIELKRITPTVTRLSVRANKSFMRRDKATAFEIFRQTNAIAEELAS